MLPLAAEANVDPVLIVLALGVGSIFGDYVNSAGFWMIKECFSLGFKEALVILSVLTCVTSMIDLGVVFIASLFIH